MGKVSVCKECYSYYRSIRNRLKVEDKLPRMRMVAGKTCENCEKIQGYKIKYGDNRESGRIGMVNRCLNKMGVSKRVCKVECVDISHKW